MPSKADYGDIDFLVSGFLSNPSAAVDWPAMVSAVSSAFDTTHCRRGYLNTDVIFSAIPAGGENDFWVQIDIKILEKRDEQSFAWEKFQLNYASGSKMLGSLIKPLGMTIDPEGLHIRVEEMEQTNFPGSMVFVSKDPWDVLKIVGLDRRFLYEGFTGNEQIYQYFASSWVFQPAHFATRLEDEKFLKHLEERSAPWVHFVKEWISEHYPGYRFHDQDISLTEWYQTSRAAMREKVFTLFPSITPMFYAKRATYLKEVEEQRLREVLMKAIPTNREGWDEDLPRPRVIVKPVSPATPPMNPTILTDKPSSDLLSDAIFKAPPSPPNTPPLKPSLSAWVARLSNGRLDTPLYIVPLPRTPPLPFTAHPPSATMSLKAKLLCIARWTLFSPSTGLPYLARDPREKKFEMSWSDHGVSDEILVAWVREMWWGIWVRQAHVNYVGMWKRRFEKEDTKVAKAKQEPGAAAETEAKGHKVEQMAEVREDLDADLKTVEHQARREKILGRLATLTT
ncbi:hypothetical protein K458DRAFT_292168 [Lentithecium fluviatile CBS 122367]|uniref:Uncharacterized protein n=1 Tax=Lentithecium fluviatile CBS 122367 TaxID=1168545 RepID=A0A6G1JHB9_9PLEO|nr:hypothetical protein K458DRAFT_292168 [Lentithecium fluviatile CBS 122367]